MNMATQKEPTHTHMEPNMREMLERSFLVERGNDPEMSRLAYLAHHVFDFTTYDDGASELFAKKALEACVAISGKSSFEYIKDPDNHRWFLIMVNMPFFARRLDWGTSIRGAWWNHADQTLESCGLWLGDVQATSMTFNTHEWIGFIRAMAEFSDQQAASTDRAVP